MLKYVEELIEKPDRSVHTRQEICEILEITDEELKKFSLNQNTQNSNGLMGFLIEKILVETFYLAKRARHVYSESERVLNFEEECKNSNIAALAQLMNESHVSCRDDFECSCKELDVLVDKCRRELKGCLAARLTGAGYIFFFIFSFLIALCGNFQLVY